MPRRNFGDQPIVCVMKEQRWQFAALAREIGVTPKQLYTAARGITAPSPFLRDRLPAFLGVPLTKLFTADALNSQYIETRPPKAVVR